MEIVQNWFNLTLLPLNLEEKAWRMASGLETGVEQRPNAPVGRMEISIPM